MGLISRVSSRTYRDKMLRYCSNIFRKTAQTSLQTCRAFSSSPLVRNYYSDGHFQSLHFNLSLKSRDDRLMQLDQLGKPFSQTRKGIFNRHCGNDRGTVVKMLIKKPRKPN